MNQAYLLLGSNDGDRLQHLRNALASIRQFAVTDKVSAVYETAAWGIEDQPAFLNIVLSLATDLPSNQLLRKIQQIENQMGRQRQTKWGQRTLDIDILFFNDEITESDELRLPHPRLHERRFTLAPLNEIAPEKMHPTFHRSVRELLSACTDPLAVTRLPVNL